MSNKDKKSKAKSKVEKLEKRTKEETQEEKEARFKRVVGKRAQFVIDKLLIMGKVLQNPNNYEYSLEQLDKIFEPIELLTLKLKERFVENISQAQKQEQYKIEL